MRVFAIAGCALLAACGGKTAGTDSTTSRDSIIVAGPPAVPSTLPASPAPESPTPTPSADSIRGIVSVVGTSFEKKVMVTGTSRRVEVTGTLSALVGGVAGADVSVVGRPTGSRLEATSFIVRSVDGQPAIDGTLRTDTDALYIVTADGARTRIVSPPPPLLGQEGARVWITGDLAKGVSSFGVIKPPI